MNCTLALRQTLSLALLAGGLCMMATVAEAMPVTIVSGAGDESCTDVSLDQTGSCVAVATSAAWAGNDPIFQGQKTSAVWVSFGQTGATPGEAAVPASALPQMIYTLTFNADPGSMITTKVWADDTAQVFVDGVALNTPDTSPADNSTCQNPAPQTPSCAVGET